MKNRNKCTSKVIAFRVNITTYDRLDLRAKRRGVKMGTYIKDFIERDLFRTRVDYNEKKDENYNNE